MKQSFLSLLLLCITGMVQAQNDTTYIAIKAVTPNTFIDGYPIDSLVRHLNVLSRNKRLRFVRSTENETRSGYRADGYVTVQVKWRMPAGSSYAPPPPPDMNQRAARIVRGVDGSYAEDVKPRPAPASMQYPQVSTGRADCYYTVRGRKINSKPQKYNYTVESKEEQELEAQVMIGLLSRLLEQFDKPVTR